MFRSAKFKVAAIAVIITMAISLLFSWMIYRWASAAIDQSARRQFIRLRNIYDIDQPYTPEIFETEAANATQHLLLDLTYLNLVILGFSGIVGYWWAWRTLEPIERAMLLQSQFAADASHELRTPLAAMRAQIEVALREKKLTEPAARELLASNLEELAKLEGLSGGLLQLTRLGSKSERSDFGPTPLNPVIDNATSKLKSLFKKHKMKLERSGPDISVLGQADALEQVVTILLDNAIKYAGSGSTVVVSTKTSGKTGVLTVADNGPGIAAADREHVFERFWRASSARSKSNEATGYGLGLAIAKEIVTQHRSDITVKTGPGGRGAAFVVTLPLA